MSKDSHKVPEPFRSTSSGPRRLAKASHHAVLKPHAIGDDGAECEDEVVDVFHVEIVGRHRVGHGIPRVFA